MEEFTCVVLVVSGSGLHECGLFGSPIEFSGCDSWAGRDSGGLGGGTDVIDCCGAAAALEVAQAPVPSSFPHDAAECGGATAVGAPGAGVESAGAGVEAIVGAF